MRAILALILVAAAVAGVAFFAGHPGQVEIVWEGWQIDTSVGVLVAAVAVVALIVALLALLVAALRRVPRNFCRRRAARRRRTGEAELTSGLVALAAGQAAAAKPYARRAEALLGGTPITLLLVAEAAQREGDTAAARRAYTALLDQPDGEFLGLRGLIGQAVREGDNDAARRLAERAWRLRPDAGWLADSLLVLQVRASDWRAVGDTLADAARRGALSAERVRHHRGVLLYEQSRAAEQRGEPRHAAGLAAKGQALAPDLAVLADQHARLLLGLGRRRAARKAIERAWRAAPHPDLVRLYLELDPDTGPLARAAALQRLAGRNPEATESHLAIAEAALAAQLWGEARRHLGLAAALPSGPSRRLCRLMARLEEQESGNAAAARAWLDRAVGAPRDPCYVCRRCGGESAEWQSLCGECGSFDTLVWRTPRDGSRALGGAPIPAAPPMLPAPDPPGMPSGLAATAQSDN